MANVNEDDLTNITFQNNEIDRFAFLLAVEEKENVKAGDIFPIKKSEIKIGSADLSDVPILSNDISRCNAVITFDNSTECFYIESFAKDNEGTSVNSEVLKKEVKYKLNNNDFIGFYDASMVFILVW